MNITVILKELAKVGVVALTEESVKSFVETKIKPIFENWGKEDSRLIELEECLSEYLVRCYAKHNLMATIVFGRLQKALEDLYIPLTLEEYRNKDKKWTVDENCYDILDNYSRILIVDMAGMGKSTIVKYFACQGINLDRCIPIVIELRRLEGNQTILEYIQTQINSFDKNINIEEIVGMLRRGDFVIFFDGYDEISNEKKPDILDAIQDFTSKASNTKIVITSREEDDLNSLSEFKCVNIKPLEEEEAYKLIEKYDNHGNVSKKLIERLKEDSSMGVLSEFLGNPLLVSLLYKTFEYKEEIPYKKIDFYEQVYAALFNDHDKLKGAAYVHEKRTKLDKFQFEQILRAFGFLCLKANEVEYSDQRIHELLEQSIKRFSWLKITSEDFLYDITHAVPFIQKDGNEYKWVHKSFMEYFASCFICYDNKEKEQKYFQKMIYENVKVNYYNVLDFCYDMDTLGFRKYVIMPYLKSFIEKDEQLKNENKRVYTHPYKDMLIQLLAYGTDIVVLKTDIARKKNFMKNKLSDRILQYAKDSFDINHHMNLAIQTTKKYYYAFLHGLNRDIYKIIQEKIPEVVKQIELKEEKDLEILTDVEYDLDKILREVTDDAALSEIIENIFHTVFQDDKVLIPDQCKRVIEEIEEENLYTQTDTFDL